MGDPKDDGQGQDPGRPPPLARARRAVHRVTQDEYEKRLGIVEEMLAGMMTDSQIRYRLRTDEKLGWFYKTRHANEMIARVKKRWAERRTITKPEERRDHIRAALEELARRSIANKQFHAAATALQRLAELDGLVGDVNVNVTGGLKMTVEDARAQLEQRLAAIAAARAAALPPANGTNGHGSNGHGSNGTNGHGEN